MGANADISFSPWLKRLAGLLPLWMMAVAVTAEGFPHPPISAGAGMALLAGAILLSFVLLYLRWITPTLALYSLLPLALLGPFDEISTAYKTPFILLCAALLSIGAMAYQISRGALWRELLLLSVAALALAAASHAAGSYWDWTGSLGFEACFPDLPPCPSLAGLGHPWWRVFIGF